MFDNIHMILMMKTSISNNRILRLNEIEEIYINNHLCYEEAKLKELESWKDNNVYETVENQNQKMYFSPLRLLGKANW